MPAASKQKLRQWFMEGAKEGYEFMIVCCDTFSLDDYPAYTRGGLTAFKETYKRLMDDRIMEVYDLRMDIEMQMNETRAFHYPKGFSRVALFREIHGT